MLVAIMSAAAGDDNAADYAFAAATATGLIGFAVGAVFVLEVAGLAVNISVVRIRIAAKIDTAF